MSPETRYFPTSTNFFDSPLALNASYRDPAIHSARPAAYSVLPLAVYAGLACGGRHRLCRHPRVPRLSCDAGDHSRFSYSPNGRRRRWCRRKRLGILFAFTGVSYVVWIGMFAIYRWRELSWHSEMLSPLLVTAAITHGSTMADFAPHATHDIGGSGRSRHGVHAPALAGACACERSLCPDVSACYPTSRQYHRAHGWRGADGLYGAIAAA